MPSRSQEFGIYEVIEPGDITQLRDAVAQHVGQFLGLRVALLGRQPQPKPRLIHIHIDGDLEPRDPSVEPLSIVEGKMATEVNEIDRPISYAITDERVVLDTVNLSLAGRAQLLRPTSEPRLLLIRPEEAIQLF